MELTLQEFAEKILKEIAFPSGMYLRASTVRDFITEIIRSDLNMSFAKITLNYFTTVQDQVQYDLSGNDITKIEDVFYQQAASDENTIYNFDVDELNSFINFDIFKEPAIKFIDDFYNARRTKESTYTWWYDEQNEILHIGPKPLSAYNVYYIAKKRWTYDEIPDYYEKYITLSAMSKCYHVIIMHLINKSLPNANNYSTLIKNMQSLKRDLDAQICIERGNLGRRRFYAKP